MMSSYDDQDRETYDRRQEQLLRERMLDGQHEDDIINEIMKDYAPEIAMELTLNPDLSENTFRMVLSQLAVSYDEAPMVSAEDVEDFDAIITPSIWPKMQQRDLITRGLRECFVRLDWPSSDSAVQEVRYRVIAPGHIVKCIALEGQPDRPGCLTERRMRTRLDEAGKPIRVETFETWDITGDEPVFMIEELDERGDRVDRTGLYLESDEYPYRDDEGAPIFPYVMYHAQMQDRLWDYKAGIELVRGTLRLAVGFTAWWDAIQQLANPQRVAIDFELPAGQTQTLAQSRNVETITAGPKTILKFSSQRDGAGRIDTYPPGLSPMEGMNALRAYAERLAVFAGLNPGDLVASGSPQSGISIIVSRDGQRRAQAKASPSTGSETSSSSPSRHGSPMPTEARACPPTSAPTPSSMRRWASARPSARPDREPRPRGRPRSGVPRDHGPRAAPRTRQRRGSAGLPRRAEAAREHAGRCPRRAGGRGAAGRWPSRRRPDGDCRSTRDDPLRLG